MSVIGKLFGTPPDHKEEKKEHEIVEAPEFDVTQYAKKLETDKPEDRAAVQEALRKWQEEAELGSIRDSAALNLLSAEEKDAFGRLWADVADLMRSR